MLGYCHLRVLPMQRGTGWRLWKHDVHVHILCVTLGKSRSFVGSVSSGGYEGTLLLCKIGKDTGSCCQGMGQPGDLLVSIPELAPPTPLSSPITVISTSESLLLASCELSWLEMTSERYHLGDTWGVQRRGYILCLHDGGNCSMQNMQNHLVTSDLHWMQLLVEVLRVGTFWSWVMLCATPE